MIRCKKLEVGDLLYSVISRPSVVNYLLATLGFTSMTDWHYDTLEAHGQACSSIFSPRNTSERL